MQLYTESSLEMAPTDTQFENLKRRVKDLEAVPASATAPASWVQRNQVLAWLIGITLVVASIVIAIYAGVIPHLEKDLSLQVTNQVTEGLKQPLQNIGQMSADIGEIKGTLKAWAPFMTPQLFKKNIALPEKDFEKSLPELKAAAQLASESRTPIPINSIADVAKRTIKLASGNSDSAKIAWETTSELLRYRSILNSFNPPKEIGSAKPINEQKITTHYHVSTEPGSKVPVLSFVPILVPANQAAAMDFIGVDQNSNLSVGPALLVNNGGSLTLDNMHLKNVVLMNIHIIYKGAAPIILENVYFLNCTFDIPSDSRGIRLADNILSSATPAVTFSLS